MNDKQKSVFLKQFVKNDEAIDQLICYTQNKFSIPNKPSQSVNTTFINTWEAYVKESKDKGSFDTLKKYLVQLQFPVKAGISKTEDYINTTLKGRLKLGQSFLELNQPEGITLQVYRSPIAGKIPLIVVPDNEDFNTIICALSNKNEPKVLPSSMGALFINGINNWNRINTLKAEWLKNNPFGNWHQAFKTEVLPYPDLYKDKLIVLSSKGYSGIKSSAIGVNDKEWETLSLIIRREHECAHLFTLLHYGYMANNIHDEIIADYAGIIKAFGQFNKAWFLRFFGLEHYPNYREGGRLQNYHAPIKLSKMAFDGLKVLVNSVGETLASFDTTLGRITQPEDYLTRIKCICEVDLITMASPNGFYSLLKTYSSKRTAAVL